MKEGSSSVTIIDKPTTNNSDGLSDGVVNIDGNTYFMDSCSGAAGGAYYGRAFVAAAAVAGAVAYAL